MKKASLICLTVIKCLYRYVPSFPNLQYQYFQVALVILKLSDKKTLDLEQQPYNSFDLENEKKVKYT